MGKIARPMKREVPAGSLKEKFIKRLAEYLVKDQAKKSIQLEMGSYQSKEWAELRGLTPLRGYPTVEEAEKLLMEWLG